MRKQLSNLEPSPLNTLTYRISFKTKPFKVFGLSLPKICTLGTEFKKKNFLNSKSASFSAPTYIVSFKDTHMEKALSNKTPALTKSMNIDIWIACTSNQLFIRGS